MIIEELTKLNDTKRKTAAVLTVLVVACICYFAITRDSVTKLKAANASYAGFQDEYESTGNQQADFLNLQKLLGINEKLFHQRQQHCFSNSEAAQFFENINAMALTYNLKPISRVISEPKNLVDDKAGGEVEDENAKPKPQFLKTQSAGITVAGNYFDIADFLNQLTGGPQKVCITDLRIILASGERAKPKASFKITLAIDLSKEIKK
ncbi:MAG: hypothetical protein IIC00_15865 [Planctomycetes bacterium]|nr:hypothetical protein [Planctomycetota bacterium]